MKGTSRRPPLRLGEVVAPGRRVVQGTSVAGSDWKRLARQVRSRRVALGYATMGEFAKAVGMTSRTIGKIERAEEVGLTTLAAVENKLGWAPGSAEEILSGGAPTMIDSASTKPPTDRAVDAVTAARHQIIHGTPERLVEIRALIEDVQGREAADDWMLRAMRVREAGRAALAEERREQERELLIQDEVSKHAG